ncbi:MAG: ferric reductase-like transmembrane domain-containing protein [Thiobacillus sp.]|nr:ferric reductase-like transmembrane domain-containing protein [Thiobacillus sp.]
MALGFAGLAMLGLQFALTARFRWATAPFGMDIIYYFHRWAAVGAVGLVVAHYAILRVRYGDALGAWHPLTAPWTLTAGRLSLLLFIFVLVTSLWRKPLGLDYDRWRIWHGVLATAAVALAIAHVVGVGHFTAAPWKRVTWIGYSVLWLLLLGYIRVLQPLALRRRPYRVTGVKAERGDTWTLTLQPENHPGMRFQPGQFAWLTLGASPFRAQEHPFSFSGSAEESAALQFSIKELGDFTRTIRHTKIGEIAYVEGPHGVFTIDRHRDALGFVFLAGGVGIAPLMSMLRTLADRRDPRPVHLVYGNARWERVIFREEIAALQSRLDLTFTHVLQEPPAGWSGLTGMLTEDNLRAALPPATRSFVHFVCGPRPMTDSIQGTLRALGVPLRRVHFELFDMA